MHDAPSFVSESSLLHNELKAMGRRAREAAQALVDVTTDQKNRALRSLAAALEKMPSALMAANERDVADARAAGLSDPMIDRLILSPKATASMVKGLHEVAILPDPVGAMSDMTVRPNGLRVGKMTVPIGVIGMIYESRPNVTVEAAALCLKAGNACILRGGKESLATNTELTRMISDALASASIPRHAVQLVATKDRDAVAVLAGSPDLLDVIIPRGGKGLIDAVTSVARVPVIKHYDGVCHVYVHRDADTNMARAIVVNAKAQRPGVCNAAEKVLIDEALPDETKRAILSDLIAAGVEIRGCPATAELMPSKVKPAVDVDWTAEYLDLIITAKIVANLDDAIDQINRYGSHHTDAIVTNNLTAATAFQRRVDSACVHVNCSTRLADGGEYGLGCEIGISTERLHARGPMGLRELTTYKWIAIGQGQLRT